MTERVALVSGANTGIGFEVVRAFAKRGMIVYLGSRDPGKGQDAVAQLKGEGDIRLVALDVTNEATLRAAVDMITSEHGKLDVLVNNAGATLAGPVLDVTPEIVHESFETNCHGPVRLTQLAVPLLRRGENARIVFVSSSAGSLAWLSNPDPRIDPNQLPFAYCAAKAAINVATILFARALAPHRIKVNACNPGLVKSKVSRFQGTRTPEQGSQVIVHLATLNDDGPTGGFFNGQGAIPW